MSPRGLPAGGSRLSSASHDEPRPPARPARSGPALALVLALALDAAIGEPPARLHPVVWIGAGSAALTRRAPSGSIARLLAGVLTTGLVVGGAALVGAAVEWQARCLPWPLGPLLEGWTLKTMLSVRALVQAGQAVDACLAANDLDGARSAATALVSRDVRQLDQSLLVSAAVESLAENTADSIVAPLLYYAVGGLPAACAYRAANTLDAMIGYRGEYEHLGKAAARLDDLLNVVPARLSAALLLAAGAVVGGDVTTGREIAMRDHARTASPNAGWPMSAMAGLLGTRLEKPGHYVLGAELPPPDSAAIDHAAEIVKVATVLAVPAMMAAGWLVAGRGRGRGIA